MTAGFTTHSVLVYVDPLSSLNVLVILSFLPTYKHTNTALSLAGLVTFYNFNTFTQLSDIWCDVLWYIILRRFIQQVRSRPPWTWTCWIYLPCPSRHRRPSTSSGALSSPPPPSHGTTVYKTSTWYNHTLTVYLYVITFRESALTVQLDLHVPVMELSPVSWSSYWTAYSPDFSPFPQSQSRCLSWTLHLWITLPLMQGLYRI